MTPRKTQNNQMVATPWTKLQQRNLTVLHMSLLCYFHIFYSYILFLRKAFALNLWKCNLKCRSLFFKVTFAFNPPP